MWKGRLPAAWKSFGVAASEEIESARNVKALIPEKK